jgi:hypothetical protein
MDNSVKAIAMEVLGRKRNGQTHNRFVVSAFGIGFASGAKGAMGELLVSLDLMKRGYSVFRAVSPETPFDLVAVWIVAFQNGQAVVHANDATSWCRSTGSLRDCGCRASYIRTTLGGLNEYAEHS